MDYNYQNINERKRNRNKKKFKNPFDAMLPSLKSKKDKPKRKYVELDYTLDGSVKQLFLNLTKMQIPFDYEKKLEPFFPEGMEKDGHGNYFKIIGDSKTMFCGHLDTYCYDYKRVWHIIEDDIIKTDGSTTLGGDDKAGILIMIKMMESNIPGLYYFFRGEEGVTSPTGTWGSKQALRTRENFFKGYDKCIAFDRKGDSSIISMQMYKECCSDEFVDSLEKEFEKNGLSYREDTTGMWCDSGVFMRTIPECTNISVGYTSEHTYNEEQNIKHLEKLVDVCIKIDWDNLPVKRDPTIIDQSIGRYNYNWDHEWDRYGETTSGKRKPPTYIRDYSGSIKRDYTNMEELFFHVVELLKQFDYECINEESFEETEEMYFTNYETNDFFGLRIIDYEIYISDDDTLRNYINLGGLSAFKTYLETGIDPIDDLNSGNDLDKDFNRRMDREYDSFDEYIEEKEKEKKSKSKYSNLQEDVFNDFSNKYPEILKKVLDILPKTTIGLSAKLWREIDEKMIKEKYPVDYQEHGTNITPDDYVDWVKDNQKQLKKYINDIYNSNKFYDFIKNRIDSKKYHYDQIQIFSNIIDNNKELVELVMKDIEINNKPKARESTYKHIWDEIIKIDYKRSDKTELTAYPELFIEWVNDYKKDIEIFYKK